MRTRSMAWVLALLFVLAVVPALAQVTDDRYEPNNGLVQATPIASPWDSDTADGGGPLSITEPDVDYYLVHVSESGILVADTWFPAGGSYSMDTMLAVFDTYGNRLISNDDYHGLYSHVEISLSPGDYYVAVAGYGDFSFTGGGGHSIGQYRLVVNVNTLSDDRYEPNNSTLQATPIAAPWDSDTADGGGPLTITESDVDFYQVHVSQEGILTAVTNFPSGGAFSMFPLLAVFDSNGSMIALTGGYYSTIQLNVLPGDYYVAVTGDGDYSFTGSPPYSVGQYRLAVNVVHLEEDRYEPNNSRAQAKLIPRNWDSDMADGGGPLSITPDDVDYFKVHLTAAGVLTVQTGFPAGGGLQMYPLLAIFDANGNMLGWTYGGGQIELPAGDYYVAVAGEGDYGFTGAQPHSVGHYRLTLNFVPNVNYRAAGGGTLMSGASRATVRVNIYGSTTDQRPSFSDSSGISGSLDAYNYAAWVRVQMTSFESVNGYRNDDGSCSLSCYGWGKVNGASHYLNVSMSMDSSGLYQIQIYSQTVGKYLLNHQGMIGRSAFTVTITPQP